MTPFVKQKPLYWPRTRYLSDIFLMPSCVLVRLKMNLAQTGTPTVRVAHQMGSVAFVLCQTEHTASISTTEGHQYRSIFRMLFNKKRSHLHIRCSAPSTYAITCQTYEV
jgi:hypothetical protein